MSQGWSCKKYLTISIFCFFFWVSFHVGQFDVTVPFKQAVAIENRDKHGEPDITTDYLLPLVSNKFRKQLDHSKNKYGKNNKVNTAKATTSAMKKIRLLNMLGKNKEDEED
jgi:hypothetical protein